MDTQTRRRSFIDIVRRHQRPGAGTSRQVLEERTTYLSWPDLTAVLASLRWAVAGAVAARLYMPERMTQDLDIVVLRADVAAAARRLRDAGYAMLGPLSIGRSSWKAPDGQTVDLISVSDAWWEAALDEAQSNRDAQGLPILTLRFLVWMKFQAGHAQDMADIARMLGQASGQALADVRALFQQVAAPGDLDDLESLIALGQLEMKDADEY